MLRLLKFIFTGDWHLHIWQTLGYRDVYDGRSRPVWQDHVCKCKVCGKVKKFRT